MLIRRLKQIHQHFRADFLVLEVSGSYQSLSRRLKSMQCIQKLTRKTMLATGCALAILGVVSIVPWRLVAQEAKPPVAAENKPAPEKVAQAAGKDAILAKKWGTLKGRFVLPGNPPPQRQLALPNNQQVADETLVVGPDGGIANVVVWVRTKDIEVHPQYMPLQMQKAVIEFRNNRLDPHIVKYWTGQPLELKNSDGRTYNANVNLVRNALLNIVVPANAVVPVNAPNREENLPAQVTCNIVSHVRGWLVVKTHPYVAISGVDGKFEIKDLPTGEIEFQVWHEISGHVQRVKIDGRDAGWDRGRFAPSIQPGEIDLGNIEVNRSAFGLAAMDGVKPVALAEKPNGTEFDLTDNQVGTMNDSSRVQKPLVGSWRYGKVRDESVFDRNRFFKNRPDNLVKSWLNARIYGFSSPLLSGAEQSEFEIDAPGVENAVEMK